MTAVTPSSSSGMGGLVHPRTGNTLRAYLTMALTLAVIVLVILGLILRTPTGDFAQYISPLSGLAGIALGYWFGRESGGADPVNANPTPWPTASYAFGPPAPAPATTTGPTGDYPTGPIPPFATTSRPSGPLAGP